MACPPIGTKTLAILPHGVSPGPILGQTSRAIATIDDSGEIRVIASVAPPVTA
jgi:hypothetical protein